MFCKKKMKKSQKKDEKKSKKHLTKEEVFGNIDEHC